ncbi:TRAP transporter substrate-binding protein DctP [Polycladidibacter hongkongensis]|uniref:TRAP transporter substrate-binding protein DctP n=1 Tax=Polycladidibacter hongkongensis TaxID=1647556 RepID=UPI000830E438|nr:TRAP transporter substrate-binding protein DctP [Pseudovibrio hongkongensis]
MKSTFLGRVCQAAVLGVVAAGFATSVSAADLRLKFAGVAPVDHEGTRMMKQIEKEIEAADVGLKVSVFPANQLGSGESLVEDTARGNIDFSMGFIYAHKDPKLDILSTPFLVSSYDEMQSVLRDPNSEVIKVLTERMDKLGLVLLNANPEGFTGIVSNKKPEDFAGLGDKGMNIRVWSSSVLKSMVESIGYQATTMAWGDIFPALQSGIVDGAICCTKEATYTIFAKSNVGKYYIEINAIPEQTFYYASKKTWNKLNDEQKKVVKAAFQRASDDFFAYNKANDAKFEQKLVDAGYEILRYTPEQNKMIVDHVKKNVWPEMSETVGKDLMDRITAAN